MTSTIETPAQSFTISVTELDEARAAHPAGASPDRPADRPGCCGAPWRASPASSPPCCPTRRPAWRSPTTCTGGALVDKLESAPYHVGVVAGFVCVVALLLTAAGWRRWAAAPSPREPGRQRGVAGLRGQRRRHDDRLRPEGLHGRVPPRRHGPRAPCPRRACTRSSCSSTSGRGWSGGAGRSRRVATVWLAFRRAPPRPGGSAS